VHLAVLRRVIDSRPEKDLIDIFLPAAVDNLRQIEAFGQKTDTPVDFAQTALPVDVIAVFRAVAVRRRPRHEFHHFGSLDVDQMQQFVTQSPVADGRDVVLGAGRHLGLADVDIVVLLIARFFDKGFVHGASVGQTSVLQEYMIRIMGQIAVCRFPFFEALL